MIPFADRVLVERLLDILVPTDEDPSASQIGALSWLDSLAAGPHAQLWAALLGPGLSALEREPGP